MTTDDDLQLINQNVETVKRLLEEANQGIFNLISQCEPVIANRVIEEVFGYLLVKQHAGDGISYALSSLSSAQESLQPHLSSNDSEQ